MDDPEVQGILKGALLRETVKNTIFMSAFLIGLLKLYDVAKAVIKFDWRGDLVISLILIGVGLIYLFKNLFGRGKNK